MTASERLDVLLKHLKISANKLALEKLGYKDNVKIYHIRHNRNNFSPKIARDITEAFPEISYSWLLTGEGDMLRNGNGANNGNVVGDNSVVGNNVNNSGNLRVGGGADGLDACREQLAEKDRQLAEKDRQISKLLEQHEKLISKITG